MAVAKKLTALHEKRARDRQEILEFLRKQKAPLQTSQIAVALGLPWNAVNRQMGIMREMGLVCQGEKKRWGTPKATSQCHARTQGKALASATRAIRSGGIAGLMAAILQQAVTQMDQGPQDRKQETLAWFTCPEWPGEDEAMSFRGICNSLDLDPQSVLRGILRRVKEKGV